MNLKNIVLIGMSGVGKTVVGKNISEKNNMKLIDTDDIIVCNSGKTIAYIFDNYGENYFRSLESNIIENLSTENNAIISTGGGIIMDRKNIYSLKENGIIFLLEASLDTLIRNVNLSQEKRPLLEEGNNLRKKIENINRERKDFYISSADYIIKVDNKSIEEIGDEIISIFKQIK